MEPESKFPNINATALVLRSEFSELRQRTNCISIYFEHQDNPMQGNIAPVFVGKAINICKSIGASTIAVTPYGEYFGDPSIKFFGTKILDLVGE